MREQEYRDQTGCTFHDSDNQAILRKFVDREVYQNISMLVHHFAQNPEALEGSDYDYDEILDLCGNIDYEGAAMNWLENEAEHDDLVEIVNDYDPEIGEENLSYMKKHELIDFIVESIDDWQDFCTDENIETDGFEMEILEHWVVSQFLKSKLEQHGEVTGELFGLDIWGRGCTGQAILLDGVIGDIASDMEILKGQRLEWEV